MVRRARTTAEATTPPDFPLASTVRGAENSNALATAATVRSPASTSPGSAAFCSRSATLTASPVTNEPPSRAAPDDDLARVDADAHLDLAAEELAQSLLHRERRVERALGVVLECRGRAEHGHHRIAGELLDRAAGELDLLAHRVVEPLELYPHALRVSIACVRGRPDEVGEENRDELALFTRVHEAEFRR